MIKIVGDCKPEQNQVKKEFVFKNIMPNLIECHVVTMLDEELVVREKVRERFFKGPVPPVIVLAQKVNNKKVTTIVGLELFMIDLDELQTYLKVKCACSVNMTEHKDSTPKAPKSIVMI